MAYGRLAIARTSPRRLEAAAVAVLLVGFVLFVGPTLGQPLLERHSFRQTQTAYTARVFHDEGIDLLHPKTPVLGEPFEVPFEFPLFQAAASLVMDAGIRDDVAMRLTGLACFVLTALLLYGLVRHVDGRVSGLAALVAFLATQFAVLWSRTSMIEYLATAGAVGFAWATIAWRDNRRASVGGLALAAGLVGMLVKPTTAVFWVLPALAYRPTTSRPGRQRRGTVWLVALVLVPLVAALLWTRHTDAVKAASPTTAWLTSDRLGDWTFGSFSDRYERDLWEEIGNRVLDYVLGPAGIALLAVSALALVRSPQRPFWLSIALAAVLPPLVLTSLYFNHDYYLAAVTPALAALIGLGVGYAWRRVRRRTFVIAVSAVVALHLATSVHAGKESYWAQAHADDPSPWLRPFVQEVVTNTRPGDAVGVVGLDWSPELLYYADRRGLMVVDQLQETMYDAMRADGYRYLFVVDPTKADLTPLTRWPWLGAIGPHTYVIGDDESDMSGAEFVSTDDPSAFRTATTTLRTTTRIPCGPPTRLPSGRRGTLLQIENPSRAGRVRISEELAPLPTRRALFVGRRVAGGGLTLTCFGQPSLVVDVFDAPPPGGS